ncbi:MAG: DUF4041 domain-containing protein [Candidatus Kapabacteria bacterium]|nr:DUF4041 domain-containing protein [Candidatus Kapabacteria bacterium]
MGFFVIFLFLVIVALITLLVQANRKFVPFKSIKDLDLEIGNRRVLIEKLKAAQTSDEALIAELKAALDSLRMEETLQDIGFYEARYSFDTSAKYQARLDVVRQEQKNLIASGNAVLATTTWTVQGSEKKGEQITNRIIKLALRAFGGESDSLIAKVKYGNVGGYEVKITKAREAIDKLGETWGIKITDKYLQSVLDELHLVYEYQEKLNEEREEQRRIREEMKEEEKARREFEKAKDDAEKEEKRYGDALERARKELEGKQGAELDALTVKMRELELLLEEAHKKKERAISQAQLTRSGHVYVISNIGSFGEDVYKIGMTRRLEPLDRIKELGDASVPFIFDVHAVIYSEDAPNMENQLHRMFDKRRVNMVNERREFFSIELSEIERAVRKIDSTSGVEFTMIAEAREYRESMSIRNLVNKN